MGWKKKFCGFLIFYNKNIGLFSWVLSYFYGKFKHLHDCQYCCVKSFKYLNFLFQVSDEKIAMEMNLIEEADIKVDSEEFCDSNDNQANNDGMRWIIILLSTVLMPYRFYCYFFLFDLLWILFLSWLYFHSYQIWITLFSFIFGFLCSCR